MKTENDLKWEGKINLQLNNPSVYVLFRRKQRLYDGATQSPGRF